MSAARNDFQTAVALLVELQAVLARLRGEFVHGIKTPADYDRATDLLDELTDGRNLSKVEEKILAELEEEILAYQRSAEPFREASAVLEATCSPVQLIKDLMETLGLTGSDLPEIGDKTAVSKVLNGERPISHRMAYALAERFAMQPHAFLAPAPAEPGAKGNVRSRLPITSGLFSGREGQLIAGQVQEARTGEYKAARGKRGGKTPHKGPH